MNVIWILTISSPIFILAFILFRFSPGLQFQILILAALVYFAVALLHHYRERTLTLEIIIEYILIAVLALLVLQGVIL